MCDPERIRIVLLGDVSVGKTAIIKRFLLNTFTEKYKSTVEDLYSRDFDIGHTTLKVDIFDTCGDFQFPAMRRLSIATAHAFLLVYSTLSVASFKTMKQCFQEIREQREDFQDIPIVVAGTKIDLPPAQRQVKIEDVSEWLFCHLPKMRAKLIECSAKDNVNIKEIFKLFVHLSAPPPPAVTSAAVTAGASVSGGGGESSKAESQKPFSSVASFKRRSSAYISNRKSNNNNNDKNAKDKEESVRSSSACPGSGSTAPPKPSANNLGPGSSAKPRSRSLIRRCSRRVRQQFRDAAEDPNECSMS